MARRVHKTVESARSAPLLLAGTVLGTAALLYGAGQLRAVLDGTPRTAVCAEAEFTEALTLEGLVLREERPLRDEHPRRLLLCADGERLGRGDPLAIVYRDGAELFRASLLLRLRRALTEEEGARQSPRRDRGAPAGAASALTAALARGEHSASAEAARRLRLALFPLQEDPRPALRAELAALGAAGAAESLLTAPESGIFCSDADDWAALDAEAARLLSPGELDALKPPTPSDAEPAPFGRLVTGGSWTLLGILEEESALRLVPGETVTLCLPDGQRTEALVWRRGPGEAGRCAVALQCADHLREALPLRRTAVSIELSRQRGLRLPAAALRGEEGAHYVLRAAGEQWVRSPVTLLARRGEEILVRGEELRPGSRVRLLTGDEPPA